MRENDLAAGRDPDAPFDMATYFLHDLSAELKAEIEKHGGADSEALFGSACDFEAWPNVPMHVMAGRDDRFFPVGFQRRVALERLGLPIDEVDGGHLAALGHPQLIARSLEDYRVGRSRTSVRHRARIRPECRRSFRYVSRRLDLCSGRRHSSNCHRSGARLTE